MKTMLSLRYVTLCLLSMLPAVGYAQSDTVTFSNPLVFSSVQGLITALVQALIVLLIPVVVFFIIYAGFKYVTAQGNPGDIEDANRALLYAVIGGVIMLGSFAIMQIVTNTVNQFRTALPDSSHIVVAEASNHQVWI